MERKTKAEEVVWLETDQLEELLNWIASFLHLLIQDNEEEFGGSRKLFWLWLNRLTNTYGGKLAPNMCLYLNYNIWLYNLVKSLISNNSCPIRPLHWIPCILENPQHNSSSKSLKNFQNLQIHQPLQTHSSTFSNTILNATAPTSYNACESQDPFNFPHASPPNM